MFKIKLNPKSLKAQDPFQTQADLLTSIKKDNLTIFDVGANIGTTTKTYLKIFPNANIHCFEPYERSVQKLKSNFAKYKQVVINQSAVSSSCEDRLFYTNYHDGTHSLLPRPLNQRRYYPKKAGFKEAFTVESTTLDDYIHLNNISNVDILKMDIQGGELEALKGGKHFLTHIRPQIIYTEIMFVPHYENSPLFFDLWSYLTKFKYSLLNVYNLRSASNHQLRFGDAIFISDQIRKEVIDSYPAEK